jgi:hypothetical protein
VACGDVDGEEEPRRKRCIAADGGAGAGAAPLGGLVATAASQESGCAVVAMAALAMWVGSRGRRISFFFLSSGG